jgi:hypothetical protein
VARKIDVLFDELRENCAHEYCENWQRRVERNKNITREWERGQNDEWLTDSRTLNQLQHLLRTGNRNMDAGGCEMLREVLTAEQK